MSFIPILSQSLAKKGFLPTNISGLLYWFRSDKGVLDAVGAPADPDDPVDTWQDQSVNAKHLTQTTDANRPLLKSNVINGHPTIRFDGSNDRMTTSSFTEIQPHHTIYVLKIITLVNSDYLYDGLPSTDKGAAFMDGSGNVSLSSGSIACARLYGNSSFVIGSAFFSGASSSHSVNNGTAATGNAGTGAPGGLTLGSARGGIAPGNIDVAEFMGYNAQITGTNLTNLMNYLSERYAITLG